MGESNGDGVFDLDKTNRWVDWMEKHQLSWANWNLTDKEETTALGVPCLTLRKNTERQITVEQGTNTLVGRDRDAILSCVDSIMAGGGKRGCVPELWDGHASERIAADLAQWLSTRAAKASV